MIPFTAVYTVQQNILRPGTSLKYRLRQEEKPLPYRTFLERLGESREFRTFFIGQLKEVPFRAYHWESPPVTKGSAGRPFEFVVTRTPGIDLPPDPGPFRSYFRELGEEEKVAVFPNLGGDARLLAPAPPSGRDTPGDGANYSHIGVFTEEAPAPLQHALWRAVGRQMLDILSGDPRWLNTAGGGVAWLHVRIDSRPKYYRHRPYAEV